jgi:hypothetical protein
VIFESITFVARPLRKPVAQSCARAKIVYSEAEGVCIYLNYFEFISSIDVTEAFSNAYTEKKVGIPNKTTLGMVTKFWNTRNVCDKCSLSDKASERMHVRTSFKQDISCN